MNFFKRIVEFFKKLFGKKEQNKDSTKQPTQPNNSKPKPKEPPVSSNPYELVASGQDSHGNTIYDPVTSNPNGTVDGVLWKPVSDHSPNAVVVVKCESIRKEDLKLEILGKGNKVLKVDIPMTGRANGNRVHFRPKRTAKEFKKSAPLKLRFFQMVDGKKVIVKVKGKNFLEVKQPARRKEV